MDTINKLRKDWDCQSGNRLEYVPDEVLAEKK